MNETIGMKETPQNTKGKIYHFICICLFIIFFIYDRIVSKVSFFANLLFLTFITFHLNFFYYKLSFLIDLGYIKRFTKDSLDKLFNLCFLLAFTAGVMFWAMYAQDPNSVLQKGVSIPIALNLFLHGGDFVLCFLEQIYFNPRKTKNKISLIFIVIILLSYIGLIKLVYVGFKYDIYPFVKENIIVFLTTCLSACLISFLGHYIYLSMSKPKGEDLLNGEELKEQSGSEIA